jgi:hypothetical protein
MSAARWRRGERRHGFGIGRRGFFFVTTGHSRSQNGVASLAYAGGPSCSPASEM